MHLAAVAGRMYDNDTHEHTEWFSVGVVHLDSFVAGRSTAPNAVLCTHLVVASLRCHVTGSDEARSRLLDNDGRGAGRHAAGQRRRRQACAQRLSRL